MTNNLKAYLEKIKSFFKKRIFYCVECEKEKTTRYCTYCQKETGNLLKINLHETVRVQESLGLEKRRSDVKDYLQKMFQGHQNSRNKEKYPEGVERYQNIDRENNWYDETVKDNKTGKVFRDVHEPLSQHISSAQKRKEAQFFKKK